MLETNEKGVMANVEDDDAYWVQDVPYVLSDKGEVLRRKVPKALVLDEMRLDDVLGLMSYGLQGEANDDDADDENM